MNDYDEPIDEGPDDNDLDLIEDEETCTVKCPSCGADVYEDADRCPYCGKYIVVGGNPFAGRHIWWIILAIAGIAMFVCAYVL